MFFAALRVFQLRLPFRPISTLRPLSYRSSSTMGAIATQTVDTTERLAALRKLMTEHKFDAYIVPSEDQRKASDPSDWTSAQMRSPCRF